MSPPPPTGPGAFGPARVPATLALALALVIAVGIAFAPALENGFVPGYDDGPYVTDNPMVRDGVSALGVAWAFTSVHSHNWHPVTWLSHMVDCQLFGLAPRGHHLTSLLLHAANGVLLFLAFSAMTRRPYRSALVAALFAVHPLHVQSVAWVAERKDVLSTFFAFAAILAYARYVRQPTGGRYLAVTALFALGLLAKPMVVTLPFVLLLLDGWPLERLGSNAGRAGQPPTGGLAARVREKLPLVALSAAASAVTWFVQWRSGAVRSFERVPLVERITNAAVSYVRYPLQAIWPERLAAHYPLPPGGTSLLLAAGCAVVVLAVTGLALRQARHRPWLPVGWFWYLGTLVPVIGLVQVGPQAMADRYTYVPLVGLFVIVAWGGAELAERMGGRRGLQVAAVLAIAVVVALALRTRAETRYWRDERTLFTRAVEVTGPNALAEGQLGAVAARAGDVPAALAHFRAAVAADPQFVVARANLAGALVAVGQYEDALREAEATLDLDPANPQAFYNRGVALAALGRPAKAAASFEQVLRLVPGHARAREHLEAIRRSYGAPP